jgi:hypothetical protein
MVDEAKAFCPGCGNSFVIESKREITSNFDSFEGTIKLGDTMFNQMLSDMGLNISKSPDGGEKPPEVISLEPAAAKPPEPATQSAAEPASNTKWYILGGVVLALVIVVLVAAVIAIYMFWPR